MIFIITDITGDASIHTDPIKLSEKADATNYKLNYHKEIDFLLLVSKALFFIVRANREQKKGSEDKKIKCLLITRKE